MVAELLVKRRKQESGIKYGMQCMYVTALK